jgi:hypothetical protein
MIDWLKKKYEKEPLVIIVGVILILWIVSTVLGLFSEGRPIKADSVNTSERALQDLTQTIEEAVKYNYCKCIEGNYKVEANCNLIRYSCRDNNQDSCDVYQHQFADHYCINTCRVKDSITNKC